MTSPMPTDSELAAFVYAEARLLDEGRFEEWLALYTADAYYWMPLTPGQTDPLLHNSLMYEDTLLLRIRVERLAGQRTFSQQPRSRSHHLLQAPLVLHDEPAAVDGCHVVRTAFHYVESRQDTQTLYAGWTTHHLVREGDALRIRLKRVDLLNSDAALGGLQLFI